jgi:ERCC4-type nuclease
MSVSKPPIEISLTETTREKNWQSRKRWFDNFNLNYKILPKDLDVGDYRIGYDHVERKTVKDMVSSTETNRVNNQVYDLSANLVRAWLFIVGNPVSELEDLGFSLDSYIAMEASVGIRKAGEGMMGHINVITVRSEMDFVIWLKHIQKRAHDDTPREPLPEKLVRYSKKPKYSIPFMFQTIPDIGPIIARNFAVHFGTIEAMVNASVEELMEVPKVGRKKAEFTYNFLRINYNDIFM